MPYVDESTKKVLQSSSPMTPGELNYLISTMCYKYLTRPSYKGGRYDYRALNEVIGVLECAKQEFYRRIAVPYEDKKMAENGDVY